MIPWKDNLSCRTFPIATIILIVINALAFAVELMVPADQMQSFFETWAVVPHKVSTAFASGDPGLMAMALLSICTAMFLHGGWAHLFGNMIFLQAFGRSVESRMGSVKYTLFYLLGGFAAWGMHMFTDPSSTTPALGASGAIAAVLGAYLVFFPKAEFKTLIMVGIIPVMAVISAWWLLLAWFGMQLISGVGGLQDAGGGGVAYWAHIGGFLAGVLIGAAWAMIRPQSDICYVQLNCDCHCKGGACKKNHKHKFEVIRLWGAKPAQGSQGHACEHKPKIKDDKDGPDPIG